MKERLNLGGAGGTADGVSEMGGEKLESQQNPEGGGENQQNSEVKAKDSEVAEQKVDEAESLEGLLSEAIRDKGMGFFEVSNKNRNMREAREKLEAKYDADKKKENALEGVRWVAAKLMGGMKRSWGGPAAYSAALAEVQRENSEISKETLERGKLLAQEMRGGGARELAEGIGDARRKAGKGESVKYGQAAEYVGKKAGQMNLGELKDIVMGAAKSMEGGVEGDKAYSDATSALEKFKKESEAAVRDGDVLAKVDVSGVEAMIEVLNKHRQKIAMETVEKFFDEMGYAEVRMETGLRTREMKKLGEKVTMVMEAGVVAAAAAVGLGEGAVGAALGVGNYGVVKVGTKVLRAALGPVTGMVVGGVRGWQKGRMDAVEARARAALGQEQKVAKHEEFAVGNVKVEDLLKRMRGEVGEGDEVGAEDDAGAENRTEKSKEELQREAAIEARARWEAGRESDMDFLGFDGMEKVEEQKLALVKAILEYEAKNGVKNSADKESRDENEKVKAYYDAVAEKKEELLKEVGGGVFGGGVKGRALRHAMGQAALRGVVFAGGALALRGVMQSVMSEGGTENRKLGGVIDFLGRQGKEVTSEGMNGVNPDFVTSQDVRDAVTSGEMDGVLKAKEVMNEGGMENRKLGGVIDFLGRQGKEVTSEDMNGVLGKEVTSKEMNGGIWDRLTNKQMAEQWGGSWEDHVEQAKNKFEIAGRQWEQLATTSGWTRVEESGKSFFQMQVAAPGQTVGDLKYIISVDGNSFEYDIDEQGYVKVEATGIEGWKFFKNMGDGNVEFSAKYGEVVQDLGGGQVRVMNTDIGTNAVREVFGGSGSIENMYNYGDGNLESDLKDVGDIVMGNGEKVDIYNWTSGVNITENPYFEAGKISPENFGGNLYEVGMTPEEAMERVLKNVARSPEQTAMWLGLTGEVEDIDGNKYFDNWEELNELANLKLAGDEEGAKGLIGALNERIQELAGGGRVNLVNLAEQGYSRSTYIYEGEGDLVLAMARNQGASTGMAIEILGKDGGNIFRGESLERMKILMGVPPEESGRLLVRLDCGGQVVWVPDRPVVVPVVEDYVPEKVTPGVPELRQEPAPIFEETPEPEPVPAPKVPTPPAETSTPEAETPTPPAETPTPPAETPTPPEVPSDSTPEVTETPTPNPTPSPIPGSDPKVVPKNPEAIINNMTPERSEGGGGGIISTPTKNLEEESPFTPNNPLEALKTNNEESFQNLNKDNLLKLNENEVGAGADPNSLYNRNNLVDGENSKDVWQPPEKTGDLGVGNKDGQVPGGSDLSGGSVGGAGSSDVGGGGGNGGSGGGSGAGLSGGSGGGGSAAGGGSGQGMDATQIVNPQGSGANAKAGEGINISGEKITQADKVAEGMNDAKAAEEFGTFYGGK